MYNNYTPTGDCKEYSNCNKRKPEEQGKIEDSNHSGMNHTNGSTKIIHREHTRSVYNLEVIDNILISYSQDRKIVCYCLDSNKPLSIWPSLGSTVNNMSFCPHDSSWLALGLQEGSVLLVNLHSKPVYISKAYYNDIKGKVMALSWHPVEEGKLLFGTGDGQVGFIDSNSGRVTSYAFFHQKPVYKVEWAPPVLVDQYPKLRGVHCAYSFADRDIVMRDPRSPMADPVKLTKVCSGLPSNICEFSFSPDTKYLAIGCQDGNISICRSSDLIELVKLSFVRKNIQHLLWKNEINSDNNINKPMSYTLIVSSNDSKVCITDLGDIIQEQITKLVNSQETQKIITETALPTEGDYKPLLVTACTRELSGHVSRVVWMSVSPHNPALLATASYDHTCQIWNMDTGEPMGNYRGHQTRTFRVEFSPNEPDLVYSFADENCVHQWKISELKYKIPPVKILKSLENSMKATTVVASDTAPTAPAAATATTQPSVKSYNGTAKNAVPSEKHYSSKKPTAHKSLFPLLHNVSSHKRGFNLLALLCMGESRKFENDAATPDAEPSLEDLLQSDEDQIKR